MRRLEIVADLIAENHLGNIRLKANGQNFQLIYSNFSAKFLLTNLRYLAEEGNRLRLMNLHAVFANLGLTVDVMVSDKVIGRLGKFAQPGIFSRVLALEPIELRFLPLLVHGLSGYRREDKSS